MKKIISCCLALLLFVSIYGQNINTPNLSHSFNREDAFNKCDYAFEGIIIKISTYMRNNHAIESDIIRVTKVFKGNLSLGTVEIVNYIEYALFDSDTQKRTTGNAAKLKEYKVDTFGIFFCKVAKELPYDPKYNIDIVDNKVILSGYNNNSNDIRQPTRSQDRILRTNYGYRSYGLPFPPGRHSTKAEVYQYLRKYPNLKIPDYAEPEPVDTTIKPATSGHHFSKHERDSLARANNPDAFDSTGKFIGYGHRFKKTKNDTISSINDASKKK
jgi:hypothetical protein